MKIQEQAPEQVSDGLCASDYVEKAVFHSGSESHVERVLSVNDGGVRASPLTTYAANGSDLKSGALLSAAVPSAVASGNSHACVSTLHASGTLGAVPSAALSVPPANGGTRESPLVMLESFYIEEDTKIPANIVLPVNGGMGSPLATQEGNVANIRSDDLLTEAVPSAASSGNSHACVSSLHAAGTLDSSTGNGGTPRLY